MKRTILAGLLLGVALAPSLRGQSQGGSVALRLECFVSGPAQVSTFRFTIANAGEEHTNIVIGRVLNSQSWSPEHRLLVKWSGTENAGTYSPGTLGPGRRAAGFEGRVDDIVIPLPPGTSYATQLDADLFGGAGLRPLTNGFAVPADVTGVLDAKSISVINSGMEGLRLLKVWTGKLVSPSIRTLVSIPTRVRLRPASRKPTNRNADACRSMPSRC